MDINHHDKFCYTRADELVIGNSICDFCVRDKIDKCTNTEQRGKALNCNDFIKEIEGCKKCEHYKENDICELTQNEIDYKILLGMQLCENIELKE